VRYVVEAAESPAAPLPTAHREDLQRECEREGEREIEIERGRERKVGGREREGGRERKMGWRKGRSRTEEWGMDGSRGGGKRRGRG
jgi:hypothetical protein